MSLQATTVHQKPVPLAKQLVNLQQDVHSGAVDIHHVQTLTDRIHSTDLGERLRSYVYTEDSKHLGISSSEAFKAVVYLQQQLIGVPILADGAIVPSPSVADDAELPMLYSRTTLFPEVLTLYWQDEPLVRNEIDGITQERVLHAPLRLEWEGIQYELVCESINRSFYVQEGKVPEEIQPWLSRHAQERTNLAVGLKRQGFLLSSLTGITLDKNDVHDDVLDLGVCVLPDDKIDEIDIELGLDASPYQGTIWFADGSYFKGTIQSTSSAGLPVGWYGGIKRPFGSGRTTISSRGSIMDSYTMVPWTPSFNRQQADYANVMLPVRQELPTQEVLVKAASGFPAYVHQMNEQLLSSCAKLFRRIRVRGVAGKVALGSSTNNVQFIVRGPGVRPGIRRMTFLFSPALPVHENLISVHVEFIKDESMYGKLIQLNINEENRTFVEDAYIRHCGRDTDGDGITLSSDPVVLEHSIRWDQIKIHDTSQYKSVKDEATRTSEEAIRTSTERVRLYSSKIGVYDKMARRIYRHDPKLMTYEVRTILTEAIQRAISATKKNSGADRFAGYSWILGLLPEKADEFLYEDVHDQLDQVDVNVRTLLNARRNYSEEDLPMSTEYKNTIKVLDAVREEMPEHYTAAIELLELVQDFPKDQYRRVKVRGRTIWATHQARSSDVAVKDVLTFIARSKKLWRNVYKTNDDNNPRIGYIQATRVIRTWALELSKRINTNLLIGAMCTEFSLNLLGNVLDLDDIKYAGLASGMFVPLSTSRVVTPGMLVTKGQLAALVAHPAYTEVLNDTMTYRIMHVFPLTSTNWIPRTSFRLKQGRYLVQLSEVVK